MSASYVRTDCFTRLQTEVYGCGDSSDFSHIGLQAHIQLTLRNKGPRTERRVGEKTEAARVVSLTCLICESLVYRISQVISPDVESSEGLVLPTDEWVEKEVLKSADGWTEVFQDALVSVTTV